MRQSDGSQIGWHLGCSGPEIAAADPATLSLRGLVIKRAREYHSLGQELVKVELAQSPRESAEGN